MSSVLEKLLCYNKPMLSVFPHLLDYPLIAPFLIRLTLAVVFFHFAQRDSKLTGLRKTLGTIELLAALFLIIGLFTQVVALIMCLVLAVLIFKKIEEKAFFTDGVNYYVLVFMLCFCLLFLGAGSYAIDLPL